MEGTSRLRRLTFSRSATDGPLQTCRPSSTTNPTRSRRPARCSRCHLGCQRSKNRVAQIVIRPLKSPEFGSRLAVGNGERNKPLNRDEIKWRSWWDYSAFRAPRPFGAALAEVIPASLLSRSTDPGSAELMSRLAERVGLLAADAARPALRSGPLQLRCNVQPAKTWDSNPRKRR
jgi:hypothetical protein